MSTGVADGITTLGAPIGTVDGVADASLAFAIVADGDAMARVAVVNTPLGNGDAISGMRVSATRVVVRRLVSVAARGAGTVTVGGIGDGTVVGTRAQLTTMASGTIANSRR
jgi:hypothetical protein